MALEEDKYISKYDGKTTDEILDYSKAGKDGGINAYVGEAKTNGVNAYVDSMKKQTTDTDGDTVQIYDVNGTPHKVKKTELLKKSVLAISSINDISAFVAVNSAGNAIGVMSKEQVAEVLGELIGIDDSWYRNRGTITENGNDCNKITAQGSYYGSSNVINGPGYNFFIMIIFNIGGVVIQVAYHEFSSSTKRRSKSFSGSWSEWG